jgi:TPR repeat protein
LKWAGVIQNFKESVRLNQQAAALGYAPAQYSLGVAYANGVGTFRDPVKAHMWFNIASARGYPNAMQSRERIASSMGEAAVARAQDKAKTCIDRDFSNC